MSHFAIDQVVLSELDADNPHGSQSRGTLRIAVADKPAAPDASPQQPTDAPDLPELAAKW